MKTKSFEMDTGKGKMKVKCEYFRNSFDLVTTCQNRERAPGIWDDIDFFGGVHGSPRFNGFGDPEDLIKKFHVGSKDTEALKEVRKFKDTARTSTVEDRCERRRSVCGGSLNVNRFLMGKPNCFTKLRYADSSSDILKMAVDTEVLCNISAELFRKAGLEICKAILSLEAAGYQVSLEAVGSFTTIESPEVKTGLMSVTLKSAGETLNANRILYALTDISFYRGIAFGWVVRSKSIHHEHGLGTRLEYAFGFDERADKLADFYEQVFDDETVVFNMSQLIDMLRDGRNIESYIQSSLLGVEDEE